jgi:branched-subunit amino acid ABC-type transport system permease component
VAGVTRHSWPVAIALVSLLLGLAGCGLSVDAEQSRVCRTILPALNPDARIAVRAVESGPYARTVRVRYDVEQADRAPQERWIICRFAAEGLSPNKAELTDLVTEEGPVSGASLYLLKRFYLETPDAASGSPAVAEGQASLQLPAPLAYALQQVLASLPRTAIYGLLAAAYALVFGLVGRINLAFGELAAVGSAATVAGPAVVLVSGTSSPALGLGAGLAAAIFAGALHSFAGGHLTLARIKSRSTQPSLIATVGLSLALMEHLRLAQSPVTVWLPPVWTQTWPIARAGDFAVVLTPITLATSSVGLAAALFLIWLMYASPFGRAWRAYADDPHAAALFGVHGERLLARTLLLAGAMAGLSGMLIVAQYGGLGFAGGFQFGLKALIAAIVGGIGSIIGALLGGIAVGLFETLWSAYLPIEGRDMALYTALVLFLVFRPGGFLGIREPTPRAV